MRTAQEGGRRAPPGLIETFFDHSRTSSRQARGQTPKAGNRFLKTVGGWSVVRTKIFSLLYIYLLLSFSFLYPTLFSPSFPSYLPFFILNQTNIKKQKEKRGRE